jgi:hypothetical protein
MAEVEQGAPVAVLLLRRCNKNLLFLTGFVLPHSTAELNKYGWKKS